jgi:hypothetical protein
MGGRIGGGGGSRTIRLVDNTQVIDSRNCYNGQKGPIARSIVRLLYENVNRSHFLSQTTLEVLGSIVLSPAVHAGFAHSRDSIKRLWSVRPSDVLAFSLCNAANAAGVRSANELCGRC